MADKDKKRKKEKNNPAANAAAAKALLERLDAETGGGAAGGYDTDAGPSSSKSFSKKIKTRKRAKTPGSPGAGPDGYDTDDGYTSAPENRKKSGKKFFRLGNKSKSQLDENILPHEQLRAGAVSPTPQFRLPIAERFATTLFDANATANVAPPLPTLLPPSAFTSTTKPKPAVTPSAERTPAQQQSPKASLSNKRTVVRFASVTSESSNSSSTSSSSGLSKFTGATSSSASSPTSSSASHQQRPLSPTTSPKKPRPDPLSLLSPTSTNNGSGAKSTPNSRAPSPSPTGSPFVVLTPSDPSAPIPSEPAAPPSSSSLARSRTRLIPELSLKIGVSKATDPPKRPVISPPIPIAEPQSAIEAGVASFTHSHTHSKSNSSALEPPSNMYSIYELPPPSPPPESPLPRAPAGERAMSPSSSSRTIYTTPTPSRSVSPSPFSQPVKRGVESPFPARPILPVSRNAPAGDLNPSRIERYRDLPGYVPSRPTSPAPHLRPDLSSLATNGFGPQTGAGLSSAPPVMRQPTLRSPPSGDRKGNRYGVTFAPEPPRQQANKSFGISVEVPSDEDDSGYDDEGYEDEILNRFGRPRRSDENEREPALQRGGSIGAKAHIRSQTQPQARQPPQSAHPQLQSQPQSHAQLLPRPRPPKSAPSEYGNNRSSSLDDESLRDTMYSIESRYSFMDQEKSDVARQRFVDRIEKMFDSNGRELGGPQLKPREVGVPPVPKIPEGIATGLGGRRSPAMVVPRPVPGRSGWF